jgi:hypothetical protein
LKDSGEDIIPNFGGNSITTLIILVVVSQMILFHLLEMLRSMDRCMVKEVVEAVIANISRPCAT